MNPELTIDAVNRMMRTEFPGSLHYCLDLGDGYALAGFDVGEEHIRPGGYISGPTQFGIVDAALWFLAFVALDRIEPMAVTSELSIRYLRPAIGTQLRCSATLDAVNRRSVIGTCRVWTVERPDKITATAQGTYAIPLPSTGRPA